jgi:hypothetical protein
MEKNSVSQKPTNQTSFLQDTLKTVKTQGFHTIDHFLTDSFTNQIPKQVQNTEAQSIQSFVQNILG